MAHLIKAIAPAQIDPTAGIRLKALILLFEYHASSSCQSVQAEQEEGSYDQRQAGRSLLVQSSFGVFVMRGCASLRLGRFGDLYRRDECRRDTTRLQSAVQFSDRRIPNYRRRK